MKKTFESHGSPYINWTVFSASLVIFPISQWKVFFVGYSALQHSILIFCAIAGIIIISQNWSFGKRFGLAASLGFLATFSFGCGLVYWPVVLFILFFGEDRDSRWFKITLWIVTSFVVVALYRWNFQDQTEFSYFHFLQEPVRYIKFVLIYLGVPICKFNATGALIAGISGLLGSVVMMWVLIKGQYVTFKSLLPYIGFILFAVLNGCLCGLGRAIFCAEYPLTRDWDIVAMPLWISFFVFSYLIWNLKIKREFTAVKKKVLFFCVIIGFVFIASYSYSNYIQLLEFKKKSTEVNLVRNKIIRDQGVNSLSPKENRKICFFCGGGIIRNRTEILKKYGLSIFRYSQ